MGILKSKEFAGDSKLEACAVSDPAHVMPGSMGPHVGKIQAALMGVGGQNIEAGEIAQTLYGPSTVLAVRNFKRSHNILNYAGRIDDIVGKKTIRALDEALASSPGPAPVPVPPIPPPPPAKPGVFIVHDVRLFGWKPSGDVLEVNGDTPLRWVIDNVISRGKANNGNLVLKIMAHGLPGFVQCAMGRFQHPTLAASVVDPNKGNLYIGPGKGGICRTDLTDLAALKGHVKTIEFHSCLVARIGPCFEANGHVCYDGNEFCYKLAQATGAHVRASIHLQYYWAGGGPNNGMHFGTWNGRVFNWAPEGNIEGIEDYPYKEVNGPPPPGSDPL